MPGIYVHIPFCARKCAYCDFVSFPGLSREGEYIDALIREIELSAQLQPHLKTREYDTVFIGGGTPSFITAKSIERVLASLRKSFIIASDAEISMEANPGTLNRDKLACYADSGINRLSIGLQSADDDVLLAIGRIHTADEFKKSYKLARDLGFDNINVDIMYALPSQSPRSLERTFGVLFELMPEHISAYSLILEENTPLYQSVTGGECALPDEDEAYELHRLVIDALTNGGYERYEISNYVKSGSRRVCRHNLNYWDNGEYVGLGLNAHSALRVGEAWVRHENVSTLDDYISAVNAGKLPILRSYDIPKNEEMFESVMLGLRKTLGVKRGDFSRRFGIDITEAYHDAVTRCVAAGWLVIDKDNVYLNDRGLDMQNEALLFFM